MLCPSSSSFGLPVALGLRRAGSRWSGRQCFSGCDFRLQVCGKRVSIYVANSHADFGFLDSLRIEIDRTVKAFPRLSELFLVTIHLNKYFAFIDQPGRLIDKGKIFVQVDGDEEERSEEHTSEL